MKSIDTSPARGSKPSSGSVFDGTVSHNTADSASPRAKPPAGKTARAAWLPPLLAVGLIAGSALPRAVASFPLALSFIGAGAALLLWYAWLLAARGREGAFGSIALAPARAQHYVQAGVQLSVYAYWGWYWRPVYEFAPLLLAQFLFAYAFGMLLSWSRRESYVLGFGPFPILFSINLFLWFKDDWFFLQFLLIAGALAGKELIRWVRDGKKVHIFNPSAFPLAVASLILILTNTTHITWGPEVASTLAAGPHIYKVLFLGGLVVMYFFSITALTASAAMTLFGLGALYQTFTGVPYFLDTDIPAAVFLGLHLLVTDPSTSPKNPLGKIVFGVSYGAGVFALYGVLGAMGAPTFYDKLLCVPILNLGVRAIERWTRSMRLPAALSAWTRTPISRPFNLAHMGVWIVFFVSMTAMGRTDGRHVGDSVPFWQEACEEGRPTACRRLIQIETSYCSDNSGWACNELAANLAEGRIIAADESRALTLFSRACELRFQAGCLNLLDPSVPIRAAPRELDLRLLLRERGHNLMEMPRTDLYARACEHGWMFACEQVTAAS